MNENINLVEILKDCPKGMKLYCTILGEVELFSLGDSKTNYQIAIKDKNGNIMSLTKYGHFYSNLEGECILFPSKEIKTWEGFNVKKPKFDPKTLKAFDKVIARMKYGMWYADFISLPINELNDVLCVMDDKDFDIIIPYNEDTKHLVGTSDEAPKFYRYWED